MENSKISWCDHTFSPWEGCVKFAQGCKFCYAETLNHRWKKNNWGPGSKREMRSEAYWRKLETWNRQAAIAGKPFLVFVGSMCDIFEDHPDVVQARERFFRVAEECDNLIFLLLTKRYMNILPMMEQHHVTNTDNLRFGYSVAEQEDFDKGWPYLTRLKLRRDVKIFLSMEPLVGKVDMNAKLEESGMVPDYIIVGGESGQKTMRPMHPQWVQMIKDTCDEFRIPFHFKQWGQFHPDINPLSKNNLRLQLNGVKQIVTGEFLQQAMEGAKQVYFDDLDAQHGPGVFMTRVYDKEQTGHVFNGQVLQPRIK